MIKKRNTSRVQQFEELTRTAFCSTFEMPADFQLQVMARIDRTRYESQPKNVFYRVRNGIRKKRSIFAAIASVFIILTAVFVFQPIRAVAISTVNEIVLYVKDSTNQLFVQSTVIDKSNPRPPKTVFKAHQYNEFLDHLEGLPVNVLLPPPWLPEGAKFRNANLYYHSNDGRFMGELFYRADRHSIQAFWEDGEGLIIVWQTSYAMDNPRELTQSEKKMFSDNPELLKQLGPSFVGLDEGFQLETIVSEGLEYVRAYREEPAGAVDIEYIIPVTDGSLVVSYNISTEDYAKMSTVEKPQIEKQLQDILAAMLMN